MSTEKEVPGNQDNVLTNRPSNTHRESYATTFLGRSARRPHEQEFTHVIPTQHMNTHQSALMRPASQGSNISKPRAKARSSTNASIASRQGFHDDLTTFSRAWNEYIANVKAKMSRKEKQIAALKQKLVYKDGEIRRSGKELEYQKQLLTDLEDQNKQLTDDLQQATNDLNDRSTRVQKAEEKIRVFRAHLNSAILEQQTLASHSKERCNAAIAEIRALEVFRKQTQDEVQVLGANLKAEIGKKVSDTAEDVRSQIETRKFYLRLIWMHEYESY
jgi:chromosome segregation ATPase